MPRSKLMVACAILLLLVAVPVIVLGTLSATARRPDNLGAVGGKLAPCAESPNCVSTQASDPQHRIEPIHFTGPTEQARDRVKSALASLPRVRVVDERDDYLHAEVTSLIFRFVDDVEFLIDPAAQRIDFRSASRAGRTDFGVNRRRMEEFRRAFERGLKP
jgi:uncharacterized protein (DUF1499 family)